MFSEKTNIDSEKFIDEVLRTPSDFSLPNNFADVVAKKVEQKYVWQQYFKEFLVYLGVIVGLLLSSAAIALIWYEADWKEWLNFLVSNLWLIAGINFLLVFILFTDRVLLRYFMFKTGAKNTI